MTPRLPDEVLAALAYARRGQGWNARTGGVQTFRLPNKWGREPCRLAVVPAHVWTYWRDRNRMAAERAARDADRGDRPGGAA